jgi:hypothetical protein
MSKTLIKMSLFVALLAIGYLIGTTSCSVMAAKKVEYKIIKLNVDIGNPKSFPAVEVMFNKMGEDGWEVVGFTPGTGVVPGGAIFKR